MNKYDYACLCIVYTARLGISLRENSYYTLYNGYTVLHMCVSIFQLQSILFCFLSMTNPYP